MRNMLVVGNWKMNTDCASARQLVEQIQAGLSDQMSCEVGICVPYVWLAQTAASLNSQGIRLGAQNVSEYEAGAYTGEISAGMLAELDCQLVLNGHSERRQLFGETSEQVAQKALAAQAHGLWPIICVGETLQQRESNQTFDVIAEQVGAVLNAEGIDLHHLVWAYEPVWAIGTGVTASPEQAQAVHGAIREQLAGVSADVAQAQILYGGSVTADNAEALFSQTDIDGGLIGGASLKADSFLAICKLATKD